MDQISDLRVSECTSSRYMKPHRLRFKRGAHDLTWDYVVSHDSLAVVLYNKSRDVFIFVRQLRPAVLMHLVHHKVADDAKRADESSASGTGSGQSGVASVASGLNDQADVTACTDKGGSASRTDPTTSMNFPVSPVDPSRACCYELCAGLVDKSGKQLAAIAREEVLEECGYDVPIEKVRRLTSYLSSVGLSGARQDLFYAEVTDDMKVSAGGGLEHEGELIEVVEIPRSDVKTFMLDETKPKSTGLLFGMSLFFSSPELFKM